MRSRAFFFTTVSLVIIVLIMGAFYIWKQGSNPIDRPTSSEDNHIRMNKTVRGEVVSVLTSAGILTIKDDTGAEIHMAIVPETRFIDAKGSSIEFNSVHNGFVIEGRGESTTPEAVVAGEIRVISSPEILVITPTKDMPITSPLMIEGEAIGNWYFEASFPVSVVDAERRSLGQHYVTATENWMSESLVPFTSTIEFTKPTTKTGFLVFKNDNPSGLKELDKTFEVPINFEMNTTNIKVFFNNSKLDPAFLCDKVFPVTREIPWTEGIGRAAIEELLKGPNDQEKSSSYFTNIAPHVRINDLTIDNGTARIDLSEELDRSVGGSCRVTAIRAQITETLKQFPTVKEVVISIAGRTDDILQP